ncbi:hypothetical protein niasHT_037511 [Heterodera trifolii]|uniref:Uncharacterized protein n=1 Tax=Heterodera trifolii TaxID=157864 RepID=A0ABD2INI1_9BILA
MTHRHFLSVSPPSAHFGAVRLSVPSAIGVVRPRSASLRSTRSGVAAVSFLLRNGGGSFDEQGHCLLCSKKEAASKASAASLSPCHLTDPNKNPMSPSSISGDASAESNQKSAAEVSAQRYISYPQRWIVLSAVCLIALSNATQWISFAPLHAKMEILRAENKSVVDSCDVDFWSSQIFQMVGVLTGLIGMFVTDRFGILISCHFASLLNLAGSVLRVISSLPPLDKHWRLPVFYTGQTVAAMSQSFFLCLSPKVAEHWFGEHQRALANSLSFIANPFGVALGSIAPVLFVSNVESQIFFLNVSLFALAFAVSALTLCVTRARPPTPPSASSHCEHKPSFAKGLKILFSSRIFYIQTLTFGMAFALQWSFFVNADKYLSRLKYPDKLNGYLTSGSAVSGTFASILSGWVVDRTKKFNEFIKGAYIGIAIVGVALNLFLRHSYNSQLDTVILSVLLVLLGFFSIPVFPISLELGVESTFPVEEATSSGLLVISGQLLLFLLTYGMQFLESKDWIYQSNANVNIQLSVDFWTLFAVLSAVYSCIFLWPRYHRLEYEQNAIFRHLLPRRFDQTAEGQTDSPLTTKTNGILLFPFALHKTAEVNRKDNKEKKMDDNEGGRNN